MTTINGEDQWCEEMTIRGGRFDLSVIGDLSGTITVQRKRKSETNWRDCVQYEQDGFALEKVSAIMANEWVFRVGVKAGDYTSGSAEVEIFADERYG